MKSLNKKVGLQFWYTQNYLTSVNTKLIQKSQLVREVWNNNQAFYIELQLKISKATRSREFTVLFPVRHLVLEPPSTKTCIVYTGLKRIRLRLAGHVDLCIVWFLTFICNPGWYTTINDVLQRARNVMISWKSHISTPASLSQSFVHVYYLYHLFLRYPPSSVLRNVVLRKCYCINLL
jgi:hypothetical protein